MRTLSCSVNCGKACYDMGYDALEVQEAAKKPLVILQTSMSANSLTRRYSWPSLTVAAAILSQHMNKLLRSNGRHTVSMRPNKFSIGWPGLTVLPSTINAC